MTRNLFLRIALLTSVGSAVLDRPATAQTVPTGFTNSLVTSVGAPTDLVFLPDTRMLIATQGGALRVYCPNNTLPGCSSVPGAGGLITAPAITLTPICTTSEQGLLGVAADPSFLSNSFVYLFYTANVSGCRNRVSRFVYNGTNNTLGSELVLIDNMPAPGGNHNAGDLEFGKDGYLYVTIGEGGNNSAARLENVLTGKVLRITRDGLIPPDNPFNPLNLSNPLASTGDRCNVTGSTTAGRRCQETFAWGFRNPFRFAFDPNAVGTRFFVNDVGQNTYEEIDEITAGAGYVTAADYGWNCREGKHATGSCASLPSMVDPIFEYGRNAGAGVPIASCAAITGGAFVPNGLWPAAYDNQYLFADYTCGGVFQMGASSPYPPNAATFASNFGGVTNLRFGPFQSTQALYYTTYASGGQIRRIVNNVPKAVASSNVPGGPAAPLTVTFSGALSSDPNGLPLTYVWDFGDGDTAQTTNPTIPHTYTVLGTYTATLTVRNNATPNLTSDPATVVIIVGTPPPGTYFTVKPCRLIDTRGTPGVPVGGPALAGGSTTPYTLANKCGIPTGVKAVAVNVTVVGPTQAGNLQLFPTGGAASSSNLNFAAGQTRANNAAVRLSASGQLSVTCALAGAGTTHFLLDVVGFFQ
jgi:glucose/arabinose dehydrogenase